MANYYNKKVPLETNPLVDNDIYNKYREIIEKLDKLNASLKRAHAGSDEDVPLSNELAITILLTYYNYKQFYSLIVDLKKLRRNYKNNSIINKNIKYYNDLLYELQTGDIVQLEFTTNTPYGNLIYKLLNAGEPKSKQTPTSTPRQQYRQRQPPTPMPRQTQRQRQTYRPRQTQRRKSRSRSISRSRSRSRSTSNGGKKLR